MLWIKSSAKIFSNLFFCTGIDTGADEEDDCDDEDVDDEDEDEEDEEEEEIDVVSIQKQKKEHSSPPPACTSVVRPSSNSLLANSHKVSPVYVKKEESDDVASITSHVAAMHNYSNTNPMVCQSAPQSPIGELQAKRDAYKRVRSWESYPPSPASLLAKKPRLATTSSDLRSAAGALNRFKSGRHGNASRSSRNPGNKQREMHNVLERKRRDDLRWNFLTLRNLLPQFSSRDRMPKVVILRKSREYIRALKLSFQKLSDELASQEARNRELRRQLQDLHDADIFWFYWKTRWINYR